MLVSCLCEYNTDFIKFSQINCIRRGCTGKVICGCPIWLIILISTVALSRNYEYIALRRVPCFVQIYPSAMTKLERQ